MDETRSGDGRDDGGLNEGINDALKRSFNANRQQHRLQLSSPEQLEAERAAEAKRSDYGRAYWQKYKKRVKRVFGTLSTADYEETLQRAEAHGKKIWELIWAEACAYRRQTILPTLELAEQQRLLIQELRRIGNNINQLARLGHVQARRNGRDGLVAAPDDHLGEETLRQFQKLEAAVIKFSEATADLMDQPAGSNQPNDR